MSDQQLKLFDEPRKEGSAQLIYWGRCHGCGEVVSICLKCYKTVDEVELFCCGDRGKGYTEHYCQECIFIMGFK